MTHLPARANPFATRHVQALAFRRPGFTWNRTMARLRHLDFTAAVVGPKGSGKTTFLIELTDRLRDLGQRTVFIHLRSEHADPLHEALRSLEGAESGPIVVLDGAEQLGFVAWRRFLKTTGDRHGLVISTHESGRLPTLFECSTSLELLEDLVGELSADLMPDVRPDLGAIFDRHRGNIRLCLRELYDLAVTLRAGMSR